MINSKLEETEKVYPAERTEKSADSSTERICVGFEEGDGKGIERLQDEVRMHDPICALDGKEDGLYFYRRIVKESRTYLEKGGMLIFEIGYDQAREVTELMIQTGFSDVRVRKDLAGLDRVVYGRYDNEWKG